MASVINIGAWILCAVILIFLVKDVIKVETGGYEREQEKKNESGK